MSSLLLYIAVARPIGTITKYLKDNNALSSDSAIELDEKWFEKNNLKRGMFRTDSYIRLTSDDKYWLDEELYSAKSREFLYIFLAIMITLAIIVGTVVFVSYNPNVLN